MSATQPSALSIEAIPAFTDNYIWLLHREGTACAVVDPGEADPVLEFLKYRNLDLRYILLTHHHFDHIGGASRLLEDFPDAIAYGPDDQRVDCKHIACHEGDTVGLADLDLQFGVLDVPAHTRSHIAFYGANAGEDLLFSGDTLFSVGCGRFFEGTPEQMQVAMDKLAALPPGSRIYCGHEYTLSNCEFALMVEPDNAALVAKTTATRALRNAGRITLPGMMEEELAVNPFMRTREVAVVEAARKIDPTAQPGASVMGVIRRWKDQI